MASCTEKHIPSLMVSSKGNSFIAALLAVSLAGAWVYWLRPLNDRHVTQHESTRCTITGGSCSLVVARLAQDVPGVATGWLAVHFNFVREEPNLPRGARKQIWHVKGMACHVANVSHVRVTANLVMSLFVCPRALYVVRWALLCSRASLHSPLLAPWIRTTCKYSSCS